VINGGVGADTMLGGHGNDIYYVDNIGDVILDDSGFDTVILLGPANLDNLKGIDRVVVSGTGEISLDGTEDANQLTGNNAANVLKGYGGNDTLEGLGGNDQLYGG